MIYESPYDKIAYFPGVIENHEEIIDLIENLNSIAVSPWETWNAYGSEHRYGELKYMQRKYISQETDEEIKSKSEYLIESLADHMAECSKEYAKIHDLDQADLDYAIGAYKHMATKFGINKYDEGLFMGPHVDWNENNADLVFTVVVYLNEDYEGGELYFNDIDIKIKPKAGSIIMFPSQLPYVHQSLQVTKGRKMLITHHWKRNNEPIA